MSMSQISLNKNDDVYSNYEKSFQHQASLSGFREREKSLEAIMHVINQQRYPIEEEVPDDNTRSLFHNMSLKNVGPKADTNSQIPSKAQQAQV